MKYLLAISLLAGFVSGRLSEVVSFDQKSLRNGLIDRNLLEPSGTTNSVTEGPVTRQQLELIQAIIQELSKAVLPDGVDLSKVNVAVIITEVLRELGLDVSESVGDLSEADMDMIIQAIIEKAAEILGVVTSTATTLPAMTSATVAYSCSVCGDGMKVGNPLVNLALPGQPQVACGALETAGANGVIPSVQCEALPNLIADDCECIPSDTSTTTVAPETTTNAPNPSTIPSCVCSPLSYTFTINLSQNCETNDFENGPGIGKTVCLITTPSINEYEVDFDTLKVVDVQFLEVDTSGSLIVINQDDTYTDVSLSSGDTISFNSVSAELNPDEPLSSQLNYIPGGVLMTLRAKSEGSSTMLTFTNRVSWTYTNSCESLPTSVGDAMGWITLSDQTEASHAFCPVAPTPTAPTTSPSTFGKATKNKAGKGTKSSKADPMAKVIKQEGDAYMPALSKSTKTTQLKTSSKSGSHLFSKGNKSKSPNELSLLSKSKKKQSESPVASSLISKGSKSKNELSLPSKSKQKQSESLDAKAYKSTSAAT